REALVGGGTRLTYAQLREKVRAFAKGLHALGVRKGDHVAILMANRPEWIVADLAVCALGGVMVAVNTWVTARQLCYGLATSEPKILTATATSRTPAYFAALGELEPPAVALPRLERVVHVGARGYKDSLPFAEVFARGRAVGDDEIARAARAIDPQDVCY